MDSNDVVHVGKNGWLYLWGGSNDVHKFYVTQDYFTEAEVDSWVELIAERNRKIVALGSHYLHFMAPEKLTVYPENVATDLPFGHQNPIKKLSERLNGQTFYLDIEQELLKAKLDKILYFKSDTHWNYQGSLVAYMAICRKIGVEPLAELHMRPYHDGVLAMDLGGKLEPPVVEHARFYAPVANATRIEANEIVAYNEAEGFSSGQVYYVGARVVFRNESPNVNPAKVVVFGDSYCEFRPHILTGLLAETFREVHFIWSSSIDYKYVEDIRPDYVITEIAERFVKKIPTDSIDIRKYAVDLMNGLNPPTP